MGHSALGDAQKPATCKPCSVQVSSVVRLYAHSRDIIGTFQGHFISVKTRRCFEFVKKWNRNGWIKQRKTCSKRTKKHVWRENTYCSEMGAKVRKWTHVRKGAARRWRGGSVPEVEIVWFFKSKFQQFPPQYIEFSEWHTQFPPQEMCARCVNLQYPLEEMPGMYWISPEFHDCSKQWFFTNRIIFQCFLVLTSVNEAQGNENAGRAKLQNRGW